MSEKQEKKILDKVVKITIIASVFIIALSLAYYLVIFIPQKEQGRITEQEKQVEEQRQEQESQTLKEQQRADAEKQTRTNCYNDAKNSARDALNSKIEAGIPSGGATLDEMKKAHAQGLTLTDDFNKYYENCLSKNGLQK